MDHRQKWTALIQKWVNEGLQSGKSISETRSDVEKRLEKVSEDYLAIKRLDGRGSQKPMSERERERLRLSITTTRDELAGYSPDLIKSVSYTVFQRNRMLRDEEKGKACNLWKLPTANPSLPHSDGDYKSAGFQLGIPT